MCIFLSAAVCPGMHFTWKFIYHIVDLETMALDITLIILGGILMIAGTIGCLLPIIPGPPLCYASLIILQLSSKQPFSSKFLIAYAVLTGVVLLLDYVIPVYGTKRFKGSKYGIWGSTIGMVLGLIFLFPIGIILGPVIGAFSGEIIGGRTRDQAFKSALGSLLGFLAGASIKFVLCISMAYQFILNVL